MIHSWQNGAPANKNRKIRVKKDNKTILLREIANQKREIGRLGLFCYISGRSHDKSGDLAALPISVSTLNWGKAALALRKTTLFPGGVEGLKSAATSRSLGNRGYPCPLAWQKWVVPSVVSFGGTEINNNLDYPNPTMWRHHSLELLVPCVLTNITPTDFICIYTKHSNPTFTLHDLTQVSNYSIMQYAVCSQ